MLEIIKSTNIEDIKDIRKRYKDNLVLVNNYTDDWNGNRKGSVYAVSYDESSYDDILELYRNIKSLGKCIIIGEYEEWDNTHGNSVDKDSEEYKEAMAEINDSINVHNPYVVKFNYICEMFENAEDVSTLFNNMW